MTLRRVAAAAAAMVIVVAMMPGLPVMGRKVATTRPVKVSRATTKPATVIPSVTVDTIAAGDSTLRLSGYDKPLRSRRETLLVTSLVTDTISGAIFTITYIDMQGRTLHERDVTVSGIVPPGATRMVDFPSWDRQQTFYYHLGPKPRSGVATPYDVSIRMRALLKPRPLNPTQAQPLNSPQP
ncbi:MAG: hypothetical protein NC187_03895 [Candidatus Amulumruptor caecigallinarius]|nr:hypothetical protein [Candidatus Amulumruptor caecigallinarius]MCM1396615.1 hypothetical protein [Candidatus Amulumruptor caecigallinarius]MCM1453327.1 hypothetical protein [bacterium]